jgi:hypothetical protein
MEPQTVTTHTVAKLDGGRPAPGIRACRLGDLRALVDHVKGLPDEAAVFVRREDGSTTDGRYIEVVT